MKKVLRFLLIFVFGISGSLYGSSADKEIGGTNDSLSLLIDNQDTIVFDFSNAICAGTYMQVPVYFISDEPIYSMDFALKFNPGIFTYQTLINYKSYLSVSANYNFADSTLRFSSSSLVPIENNIVLVSLQFSLPVTQIDFAQFDSVYTLLNGDICSVKAILPEPPPVITTAGPTTIFPGDSLALSFIPAPGLSYTWSTGETGSLIYVYAPGTYFLNTLYPNGCNTISYIAIQPPDPLPIQLLTFTGIQVKNSILLSWATATEINNSHFLIQQSKDAINWKILGRRDGHGNSAVVNTYDFTIDEPANGINYFRLVQFDFDGTKDFSDPIAVEFVKSLEKQNHFSISPNPAAAMNLHISFDGMTEMNKFIIQIYTSSGVQVFIQEFALGMNELKGFTHRLEIQNELVPGVYLIAYSTDRFFETERLVIF